MAAEEEVGREDGQKGDSQVDMHSCVQRLALMGGVFRAA